MARQYTPPQHGNDKYNEKGKIDKEESLEVMEMGKSLAMKVE
jgi:hypothetical protein